MDNCAPNRRKSWYRKKSGRRKAKNWLSHPGKTFRRTLPIWAPFTKKRGRLKSYQKPFMLFAIFVDILAKLVQWILDLLNRRKDRKPLIPIPIPKPMGKPAGGRGGKGRTSGPSKSSTCAGTCGCIACDEICRPWFCAQYCAEDAGYYNQECRCPGQAIDLDDE